MKAFPAVLLVIVGSAVAQYGHGPGPSYSSHGGYSAGPSYASHGYEEKEYHAEPHYSFAYEVHDAHTGDIKSHKEDRKGEHTQGVYSLVEPDGSKRTVEYLVQGKSGFNAKVLRDHSKHPSGGYKSGGYSNGGYSNGGYSNGGHSSGGYSNGGYSSGGYGSATSYSSLSTHGSLGGYSSGPSYAPQPSYHAPQYSASQISYHAPQYSAPQISYHAPQYSAPQSSYHVPQPSYKPSYGGGATSSVSIATHGAKINTQTYHAIPSKHY